MSEKYYFKTREEPSYVAHSSGPWEDHKYIKKEGDKYIYPEDKNQSPAQPAKTDAKTVNQSKPSTPQPASAQQPKKQETAPASQPAKTDATKQNANDKNSDKHISEMASSVIKGKYGNGDERKKKLRAAGESWERIQNKVNEMLGNKTRHKVPDETSSVSTTSKSSKSSKSSSKSAKKKSTSSKKRSSGSSKKRKSSGSKTRRKTSSSKSQVNTSRDQDLTEEEKKLKDQVKHGSGGYYIRHSDERDYVIHSSGPWKKHKYLKKIGDGANAVYQYANNYVNGVKNANRDYQRAKNDRENARAFSKIAREEAPRDIKASKRREKAAINAYNHTGDYKYLSRASSEQQKQTSISRGVYNSARAANNAEKRVSNAKKYRKRAATKPARDLINAIKSRKKNRKRNLQINSYWKGNLKFGTPKSVGDRYNIKKNKDGSVKLTPKRKKKQKKYPIEHFYKNSKKSTVNLGGGKSATYGEVKLGRGRSASSGTKKKKAKSKVNLGGGVSASYGKVKLH